MSVSISGTKTLRVVSENNARENLQVYNTIHTVYKFFGSLYVLPIETVKLYWSSKNQQTGILECPERSSLDTGIEA